MGKSGSDDAACKPLHYAEASAADLGLHARRGRARRGSHCVRQHTRKHTSTPANGRPRGAPAGSARVHPPI
jgi:hypothetical protein